jgi:hypothetical protein
VLREREQVPVAEAGGGGVRGALPAVVVGGSWGAVLLVLFGVPWAGVAVGAAVAVLWLLWRFLPQLDPEPTAADDRQGQRPPDRR